MGDLKTKYEKYGIQDWIALGFGTIGMGIQLFRYATDSLGEWPLESAVFAACSMLMFAPKTILDLIRKARGLDVK